MSTIFISHSSRDNALAVELAKRLEQQNHHSVFLDFDPEQGIVAGQSWEQTLYRKLRACQAMIVLCTDHYLSSQWCFAEIALARMEGKNVIVLKADLLSESAKIPSVLTQNQFIDLRTDTVEAYRRLWKGLKEQDLLGVPGDWSPHEPPYLGLSAYREEHAPIFFGREDETRAGLELLSRGAPGLIMVLGSSGSGKSSLVQAGILPQLRHNQQQWLVLDPFRPGLDPYIELAESLAQTWRRYAPDHAARVGKAEDLCSRLESWSTATPPLVDLVRRLQRDSGQRNARVLIIVDQFEEILGHEGDGHKANRFLGLLRDSLEAEHSPLMTLGTMRSDFLGVFQRNAALRGIDFESLSIGPMRLDGIRRVIEEPAKLGALELESGLSDRLMEDTETPDALPLLSFTLSILWRDYHKDGKLTISNYQQLGELDGAIAREADALLATAKKEGKAEVLRNAFLSMAWLTEDGGYARRPVAWNGEELRQVQPVLERFIERRLLMTWSEGGIKMVEVAHEALFRSWRPLKTWLDNDRAELLLLQQINRDALVWQESKRGPENLWRGGRLEEAKALEKRGRLAAPESEFVRASWRSKRMKRWMLICVVSTVFVALTGLAGWALKERQEARRQSVISHAQQLAAQAQLVLGTSPQQLERSVLLGVQAVRTLDEAGERRAEVARALQNSAGLLPTLLRRIPQDGAVDALSLSEDGARITILIGNTLTQWDVAAGIEIGRWALDVSMINGVAMEAPVVAATDRRMLRVFDIETGRELANTQAEMAVAVALNSRAALVAAAQNGADRGGAIGDDTIRVWRIAEDSLDPVWMMEHQPDISTLAFAPKGDMLAAASERDVSIWRITQDSSDPVATVPGGGVLAFSPDGKRLAVADKSTVQLWDPFVDPPRMLRRIEHAGVMGMAFRSNGKQLATSSGDRTVRLWSVSEGFELLRMPHRASVGAVLFGTNDARLITGSGDRLMDDDAVRFWDMGVVGEQGGPAVEDASFLALANGTLLRGTGPLGQRVHAEVIDSTESNPSVRIWRPADDYTLELIVHDGPIAAIHLSADARVLATASGKRIRVFELSPFRELEAHDLDGDVYQLAVGPAGRWLLASTRRGRISWLWDLSKHEDPQQLMHKGRVLAIAIADDGSRIATSWSGGATRLWTLDPLASEAELPLAENVTALAFAPGSRELATGSSDKSARLWDVRTGDELVRFDHLRGVLGVAFTEDGNRLVTSSFAEPFGSFFVERPRMARIWILAPGDAITDACKRLKRDLTEEERIAYSQNGELFDPTCPAMTGRLTEVAADRQ